MLVNTDTRWQAVLPLRSVDIQPPDLPTTQRIDPATDSTPTRHQIDAAFADDSLVRVPFDPDAPTGPPPAFEANVLEARYETWARPDFDLTDQGDTNRPRIDLRR